MTNLFRIEERQRACEKIFEDFFFHGKRMKFAENVRNFGAKAFSLEITSALCP